MKNAKRSPTVAGWLSFFVPGAGQIYCNEIGKGIAFWFAVAIGMIFLVPGLLLWIACILDAVRIAKEYNESS